MRTPWCLPAGFLLLFFGVAHGQATKSTIISVGFLDSREANGNLVAVGYTPQPGDIILFDAHNRLHHAFYKMANTSAPTHSAIVIAKPGGGTALLDIVGPFPPLAKVEVVNVETRLPNYKGSIMVRRIKQPLTPEQNQRLTDFAYAQNGKRFALGRIILQVTPFCPRNGLRHTLFARTELDRSRWFCSELVIAACTVGGVLDSATCPANATYPRDLAYDERFDFSPYFYPPTPWANEAIVVKDEKRVAVE